ncbi:hypothetical protein ACFWBH_10040 [Streptomyces sp. NPDC059999]|uniref:hypothetical protein n=1 Tax=Streptomyces sp. NPDC059999 TaxID=3347030 RepID=UPI0036A38234
MKNTAESYEHLPHPLLHQQVRDRQSYRAGQLMAVVREPAGQVMGRMRYTLTAYIKDASSAVEFTAAPGNLERA